ncbi:MAG: hypothetical protein H7125_12960 [Proteobacteria bacterium]|nr:hypothetical protein [Burkholderiales bacterium]
MSEASNHAVIIDNRPGAGGNVGAEVVARATPDGYTILNISLAHAINATLYPKLAYSVVNDFTPFVYTASSSLLVGVHAALPVKRRRRRRRHSATVRYVPARRGRALGKGREGDRHPRRVKRAGTACKVEAASRRLGCAARASTATKRSRGYRREQTT